MSYFKFLVIIFSIFLSFDLSAKKDFLNVNGFYLSKDDLTIFKQSLKEGDKAKWARTLTISKGLKSNLAKKIIKWRWLTADDGLADLSTLKDFYVKNNKWPKVNKITNKIESKINIKDHKTEMLWFQETPPKSGIGKIKLAEMLIKNNFVEEGYWMLNQAWINHTFPYSEEKYILSK